MAKSLNEFISEVKRDGLARQNRFSVVVIPPPGLLNGNHNLNLIQLFCEQAVLPGITYASQPIKTFGEDREVVYDRNFEDITLTFLVDRNLHVKRFFDDWTNLIIDERTRLAGFYEEYVTNIIVYVQDLIDQNVYSSTLLGIFPKTVSQIQLDNNSKDVMKMSVTFAYEFHINEQFQTSGGEPEILSQYKPPQLSSNVPTEQSAANYLKGSVSLPTNMSELYFDNFSQYQTVVNDGFSAKNAINLLERSGFTSGTGGLFT